MKNLGLFVILFCLGIHLNAQLPLPNMGNINDSIENSIATNLLNKCIKRKMVYCDESQKVNFDSISFIYIPKYKIDEKKIQKLPCDSLLPYGLKPFRYYTPYLILLIKQGKYYGVISTDDCNNSYIDINYNYEYDDMQYMNSFFAYLQLKDIESFFQIEGSDQIFVYYKKQVKIFNDFYLQEFLALKTDEPIKTDLVFEDAIEYYCKPYSRQSLLSNPDDKRCNNTKRKLRCQFKKIGYGHRR